jgi:hypothetical protein
MASLISAVRGESIKVVTIAGIHRYKTIIGRIRHLSTLLFDPLPDSGFRRTDLEDHSLKTESENMNDYLVYVTGRALPSAFV